jgi:uncharacterized protein (DUF58 family)
MASATSASASYTGVGNGLTLALTRRRVYILPTRHGMSFATAVAVMLLGSMNYANSLGYLLSFLLASVMLVSLLHAYRNLAGLTLRLAPPAPVFAGEKLDIHVALDNRRGRQRHSLCLTHPESIQLPARKRRWTRAIAPDRTQFFDVQADAIMDQMLSISTHARGVHDITTIDIATRYPLGLFRAWSPLRAGRGGVGVGEVRCWVYPTPTGSMPLPIQTSPDAHAHDRTPSGRGREDFSGLRKYQHGDPPRQIHWKAAARSRDLPVKEFHGEASVALDLNWTDTDVRQTAEQRLSQLSRWIVDAHALGASYSLQLPWLSVALDTGVEHQQRCLRALTQASFSTNTASAGEDQAVDQTPDETGQNVAPAHEQRA